jgi:hypothetical protein
MNIKTISLNWLNILNLDKRTKIEDKRMKLMKIEKEKQRTVEWDGRQREYLGRLGFVNSLGIDEKLLWE